MAVIIIRKMMRFLRNIVKYYPILIEDEDWDYVYLYKVIRHKLKLMNDFYSSDKPVIMVSEKEKISKEINQVIEILDRLIEEDYMPKDSLAYYSSIDIHNRKEITEEEKVKLIRWWEEEEEAQKKDKELFFELLSKKIDGWWD